MKVKIALLVGHYGVGTGCSYEGRDEWAMAFLDAHTIAKELNERGHSTHVFFIDRASPTTYAMSKMFSAMKTLGNSNHEIRAICASVIAADVAIELHYNSAEDHSASGHEVLVEDDELPSSDSIILADLIHSYLTKAFPEHKARGVKRKALKVLSMLMKNGIPSCIVEPAFIFEPILDDRRTFTGLYYKAMIDALEDFAEKTGRKEVV